MEYIVIKKRAGIIFTILTLFIEHFTINFIFLYQNSKIYLSVLSSGTLESISSNFLRIEAVSKAKYFNSSCVNS